MGAKARRPVGRPKKELNRRQVQKLAEIQCTYDEMALVLGCSTDTLKRNFADLIEKGREVGKTSLRRTQFRIALKGNTRMLIWLGKQHLGQSDRHEHAGPEGGPIPVAGTVEFRVVPRRHDDSNAPARR